MVRDDGSIRFDPATEVFASFPSDRGQANVRQLLGHPGEVWGGGVGDRPAGGGRRRLIPVGEAPRDRRDLA